MTLRTKPEGMGTPSVCFPTFTIDCLGKYSVCTVQRWDSGHKRTGLGDTKYIVSYLISFSDYLPCDKSCQCKRTKTALRKLVFFHKCIYPTISRVNAKG